jgi:TolB protein
MTEPEWWQPQPHMSAGVLGLDAHPWSDTRSFERSSLWDNHAAQPWPEQALFSTPTRSAEEHSQAARIEHDPITGRASAGITFTRFDGTTGHVFAMRPDGSHVRQLTDAEGVQAHSTWAPNGRFLVFTQVDAEGSSVQLLRTGAKQPRSLSGPLTWSMVPHVSPNSRRIAFTSNNDGNYEIYSVARNGSGMRQLTYSDAPVQQVGPKYSPNGKRLLFASDRDEADPTNQQDLWTMASDGGPMQRLTQGLNNRESRSWSPDGRQIVSQTVINGVGQIVVMDADGGNQRQITRIPSSTPVFSPGGIFPDMRGAVTPAWSPNGRWIAFASNHRGNYDLFRIRPDGTGLRRILKSPDDELSVGWGPRR